jgi:LuxR family maltose regulon positive regulatory protein
MPRQRLLDLISQGVELPLTLISAPAGFGKTVAVASWEALYSGSSTIRHLTLDHTSEQPAALLKSVLEGLRRRGSALSEEPVLFTPADRPGAADPAADSSLDEHALILVVDCGDLTITPELGRSLDDLVHGSAGRVRTVLLTRTDPLLPLHRYRLAGAVTEIRAADLAFTVEETEALMRHQGVDLTPAEVEELHARTAGWPAGLMFAAMSLAGRPDTKRAIREFRGDAGNVAAYLMKEVLDAQALVLRTFLLRTCIVDEFRPALAEALTGHACDFRSLEFLSRGNTFIQAVPGTKDCYSYQPLFRELLRAQLHFERPSLVPHLHRVAAVWYARDGQLLSAIRHAIAARRWGDAARYLMEDLHFARLLVGGERRLLETMFADLPDDLGGAEAAMVRAAQALAEFDVVVCRSELAKARMYLDRDGPAQPQVYDLAVTVLQAVSASLGTDVDAGLDTALAAEAALRAASSGSVTAHPELKILVAGCKGRVLLQRGDFPAASAALAEGVAVAEAAGVHEALAEFLGMAALVEAVWGHLGRAGEIADQASALAESGAHLDEPRSAIVAQAWVCADRGDLTAAEDLVHQAAQAAPTYDSRVLNALTALVRARLLWAAGDVELAGAELRAARNSYGAGSDDWLSQALLVDEAKILVAENQPHQAMSTIARSKGRDQVRSVLVMQRAATEAGESRSPLPPLATRRSVALDTQVDGCLVQAAEAVRTGDTGRTVLYLERALRLAAPEHLRRPFLEAPPAVQKFLQPSGELMRRHPWLQAPRLLFRRDPAALDGSGDRSGRGPAQLIRAAALTSKEHEVLEYLAELLTTEEIATTMYVSVNTVRSHVRSILRKLNASRRNEAVRRAWELGLLPVRPDS